MLGRDLASQCLNRARTSRISRWFPYLKKVIPEPTGLEPGMLALGRGVFLEQLETALF
jgi:hypothetical protein